MPWMVALLRPSDLKMLHKTSVTFILDDLPPTITIQCLLVEWRKLDHLLMQSPFAGLRRIRLDFVLDYESLES